MLAIVLWDEGVADEVLGTTSVLRLGLKVHHSHFDEFSVTVDMKRRKVTALCNYRENIGTHDLT